MDGRFALTQRGPEEITGRGNYWLPVYASDGSDNVAAVLYFLDGGTLAPKPPEGPGGDMWIEYDQVEWFRREAEENNKRWKAAGREGTVPSFCFFHIPLPEYQTVWETGTCLGVKNEAVSCPKKNTGLFLELRRAGVLATFCGHDHTNNFRGQLDGVWLCYGNVTGWPDEAVVSIPSYHPRGSRVVTITEVDPHHPARWVENDAMQGRHDMDTFLSNEKKSFDPQSPSA